MLNILFALFIVVALSSGCIGKTQVKKMINEALQDQPHQDISKTANMDDLKRQDQNWKRRLNYHKSNYPHGCDCK